MKPALFRLLVSYIKPVAPGYRRGQARAKPVVGPGWKTGTDVGSEGLADLISRHEAIVRSLLQARQGAIPEGPDPPVFLPSSEEINLRTRIVRWQPIDRDEAYRKLEHLARALIAGVPIDKVSVDIAVHSVEAFLSEGRKGPARCPRRMDDQ